MFVEDVPTAVGRSDRALFDEYRLTTSFGAKYVDSKSRTMIVEAFRFQDTVGAHAAFLASRPNGGVSPMIWNIGGVTGGGVTVLEYRNYVLRFSGALPTVSSALEEMLTRLPGLTTDDNPWDLDGRYLDSRSTRMILGPVSLARFEARITPSVAAFRLGATGRIGSFETPAGRMTKIVSEYPGEAIAKERLTVIAALPNSVARRDRTCLGVVLEPLDSIVAQELLEDTFFCGPIDVTWYGATDDEGFTAFEKGVGWGLMIALGLVVGLIRRAVASGSKVADRIIPRE